MKTNLCYTPNCENERNFEAQYCSFCKYAKDKIEWAKNATSDPVNHPSHYASGKIEVIEAIEDWAVGFHLGNVIKYAARAGKKDPNKEIEDLEKAMWYLKRKIELLKANKEGRLAVRPNDMNHGTN